jgi:hypothetical protein
MGFAQAVAAIRARLPVRRPKQLSFPYHWLGPITRRSGAGGSGGRPPNEDASGPGGRQPNQWLQSLPRRLERRATPRGQLWLPWATKFLARSLPWSIPAGARLTTAERKAATDRNLFPPGWDRDRPKTRAECARVPRPCPYASCRFSNFLEVGSSGTLKLNHPGRELADLPPHASCALDVAERLHADGETDDVTLEVVGAALGLGIERIRQITAQALQDCRVAVMREARRDG